MWPLVDKETNRMTIYLDLTEEGGEQTSMATGHTRQGTAQFMAGLINQQQAHHYQLGTDANSDLDNEVRRCKWGQWGY